jgi:hypothetical protein
MNQLREMGFKNDSLNKQVLIKTQGNIEASVDILSRQNNTNSSINQMLTPAPASPALLMSDDQKLESLMRLGFTDMTLNRDVLRRAGGNLDIAMTILKEGVTNNNNNNIFQSPQPTIDLAGRAQTTQERQAYKLGGMNVSNGLVNVNDTSITSSIPTTAGIATSASVPNNMSAYNPFGLQQQQPQQQMLQQSIQPSLQQPLQQPQQQLQQQITFDGTGKRA